MTSAAHLLRHDLLICWRASYGHPDRRVYTRRLGLALLLVHLGALAAGLLAGRSPAPASSLPAGPPAGLLSLAFCAYAFGGTGLEMLDRFYLARDLPMLRLAPLPLPRLIVARLLLVWLLRSVRPFPLLALFLLPMVVGGQPAALLGYLILPVLALPPVALAWALTSVAVHQLGTGKALFVARILYYLSLAGTGYLAAHPPTGLEEFLGWWVRAKPLPLLLAAAAAPAAVFIGVTVALWQLRRGFPAEGQHRGKGSHTLQARGFWGLVRKELRITWRYPQSRSSLFAFPPILLLVGWAMFRDDLLAVAAVSGVFGPSLLAMTVGEILSRYEERHVPWLLTSPVTPARLMAAKAVAAAAAAAVLALSGSLLLVLVGRGQAAPFAAITGLLTAGYYAYIVARERFWGFVHHQPVRANLNGALALAVVGLAATGVYLLAARGWPAFLIMVGLALAPLAATLVLLAPRYPTNPTSPSRPRNPRKEIARNHRFSCPQTEKAPKQ